MSLSLRRSDSFRQDFDLQFRWYLENASVLVAERFLVAVTRTIERLAAQPGLGRARRFLHPDLQGFRSFRVQPPFDAHLIFYRSIDRGLSIERMMHGRRDLPRRLLEPPSFASR